MSGFIASAKGTFQESAKGDAKSGASEWVRTLKERPKNKPFFLWLAALDPHRPYDQKILKNPTKPEHVTLPPYVPDTPEVRGDYALYYDEIRRLDRFVGEVLAELKRQKVDDNTLVMFISDNGRPMPRDKTTLYDSGVRTPWIVRWPAKVKAGTVNPNLVSSVDIARPLWILRGPNTGTLSWAKALRRCWRILRPAFAIMPLGKRTGMISPTVADMCAVSGSNTFATFIRTIQTRPLPMRCAARSFAPCKSCATLGN